MSILNIVLLCVVALFGGYAGVGWLFKKGEEQEDRRRSAAKLAATLSGIGLKKTPEFLIDYSVGDYSAMALKIKELANAFLGGEATLLAEFEDVFERLLAGKLRTENGRIMLAAKLADAVKEGDATVVGAAPKAKVN